MPKAVSKRTRKRFSYARFLKPLKRIFANMSPLVSRGNKPLEFTFEQELISLILFHLEEHRSGQELLQFLDEDEAARKIVGAPEGVKQSTFYEAINTRGLTQMSHVFNELLRLARKMIPSQYKKPGKLVAIDGSLIETSLTMDWADYRNGTNKAIAHVGFDLNRSIPMKIHLHTGKSDERPYMFAILDPGQTCVTDRYYQRCRRHHYHLQTALEH